MPGVGPRGVPVDRGSRIPDAARRAKPHRPRVLLSVAVALALLAVTRAPAPAEATPTCFGKKVTIRAHSGDRTVGTARADVIWGTGGADVIDGKGGADRVCGRGGADTVRGGSGPDRISGGSGRDELLGQAGKDQLSGGPGRDTCRGGGGRDRLTSCNEAPPQLPSPTTLARRVLSEAPHAPADIGVFSGSWSNGAEGAYPTGPGMGPATGPEPVESTVRSDLADFLADTVAPARATSLLSDFDSTAMKGMIADPTLRAAFVGLGVVPFLAPVVSVHYPGGDLKAVEIGPLPDDATFANTGPRDDGCFFLFNPYYLPGDFREFMPTMAHELVHCPDRQDSYGEEIVAHSIDAMVEAWLIAHDPARVLGATSLERANRTDTMGLLNSRPQGSPHSQVYADTGTGVFPGSPYDAPDFATAYAWVAVPDTYSVGYPAMVQVLQSLGVEGDGDFSKATLQAYSSLNQEWITDVQRVQVLVALGLVTAEDVTGATSLSEQDAVAQLGLAPYLAVAPHGSGVDQRVLEPGQASRETPTEGVGGHPGGPAGGPA